MLHTSKDAKGGAVSYDRFKKNAINILKENNEVIVTCLLDLYGLDTDFPNYNNAKSKNDLYEKVTSLEDALHKQIIKDIGFDINSDRFIPYIQPYELEGLLFSDVNAFVKTEPDWKSYQTKLEDIVSKFKTPEHINDGFETKPSKRLEILKPNYKKTLHLKTAAENITLTQIESKCHHFKDWVNKLRQLA